MPAAQSGKAAPLTLSSVLALASAGVYALALVLAQIGLRHQAVLAGAMISLPTTALAFWLATVAFPLQGFDLQALLLFAAVGALYPVAVTLLSFQANRHLGPTLAGALGNVTPLVAVGFAVLVLGEQLTAARAVGVGIVLAGVLLLSFRGPIEARRWLGWALLLPLAGALIRGGVQPVVKLGLARWPEPLAATLVGYTVSAALILAIGFTRSGGRLPAWTAHGIGLFMVIGLGNGASVLLMYAALQTGSVSLVAPLLAVYPFFTLLFSRLLLRVEPVDGRLLAGLVLTVAGVAIVLSG